MKRLIIALMMMLIATAALAQTTSAPAIPSVNVPAVETIIASVPANIWPVDIARGPNFGATFMTQNTAIKAWSDAHARGQAVDFSMLTMKARPMGAGVQSTFLPSRADTTVTLINMGDATKTTLPIDQVSIVVNNGKYTIVIVVK